MKSLPQLLFADRLPPLVGGMEVHAGAYISHFQGHPRFPLIGVVQDIQTEISTDQEPAILFFNSGKWIEQMYEIRSRFPRAKCIYRTGGNEIVKAPLSYCSHSHVKRQSIWVQTLNRTVDWIVTNSSYTEKRLSKLGLTTPYLRCVGGAYPVRGISRPLPGFPLRLFCAARYVPYKNHKALISVCNSLYKKGRAFSLSLAGEGPLEQPLRQLASENPQIRFLGVLDSSQVAEEMASAHVYVQLSADCDTEVPGGSYLHTEGMGRSILEAISSGTYVLAGRSGALSEIVHSGRGTLVPSSSALAIEAALEELIAQPPQKGEPTEIYCFSRIFQKMEDLYARFDHH